METHEKIKLIREIKDFSQEQVAELMGYSPSQYAKIERGETKLTIDKLEKLAQIFDVDISKLVSNHQNLILKISSGTTHKNNGIMIYSSSEQELENKIDYLEALLKEKDKQIKNLEEIISLLKNKNHE